MISNSENETIFCNLQAGEKDQIHEVVNESMRLGGARAGVMVKDGTKVYGFTNNKDYILSSQKFRTALSVIMDSAVTIGEVIAVSRQAVNKSTSRLLHNLTSLNAHNIQEIYSLLPQEMLAKRTSGQVRLVEDLVSKQMRDTALALLRIAKNNAAMKTEFSVFNKLFDSNPKLQRKSHNVHKVLMNVFYIFFADFTDKDVKVEVECEGIQMAYFDYESIHVALFQIIENAVKYIQPKTDLSVCIYELADEIVIDFKMISLQITSGERKLIFDEGFSGTYSEKTGKSGSGIGLSRAKDILLLNSASIEVDFDSSTQHTLLGVPYQNNTFLIRLPRKK
ncbi:sensor histidine kinase [Pseudomonas bubulae]|uniref:sensor histidine kinase n=1 Tax=Pseudomonas bubulae TaxID=2316085 RepID=UPI0030A80E91